MGESGVPSYYERIVARIPTKDRYKCLTCGFLAGVSGSADIEVPGADRLTGIYSYSGNLIWPFCFEAAYDLAAEMLAEGGFPAHAAIKVIAKDRHCAEWYPYTPGASPLWHHEEMRMMHLEEMRAQRERELAEWKADADKRGQQIAEKLHDVTVEMGKFTTKWTYAAIIVAVVALLVVTASWLFPDRGRQVGNYFAGSSD